MSIWAGGNLSFALTSTWDVWVWGENFDRELKITHPDVTFITNVSLPLILCEGEKKESIILELEKDLFTKRADPGGGKLISNSFPFLVCSTTDQIDITVNELCQARFIFFSFIKGP